MRAKKKSMLRLGTLLGSTRGANWKKKLAKYALWNRWEELAGPSIAEHARPFSWRKDTLIIAVEHPVWMQELQYCRSELMAKIRAAYPNLPLKNIRFELGTLGDAEGNSSKHAPHRAPALPPLTDDERSFAADSSRPIADDATRTVVRRLIEKDLALKKYKAHQ